MSAHTPGPWAVDALGNTLRIVHSVEVVDGREVGDDLCRIGSIHDPVNVANAHLIASAPALLASCEVMADWIRRVTTLAQIAPKATARLPESVIANGMEILAAVRDAATFARGESP